MRGFTLIEVLISLALAILLIGAALPLYTGLQTSSQLNESAGTVVQALRLARTLSVERAQDSGYGVYIESNPATSDRIIFFLGTSYAARNAAYDRVTTFDNAITLTPSLAGGVSEIVFSRVTGTPSSTGTIAIIHATTGSRTLSINSAGAVDYE